MHAGGEVHTTEDIREGQKSTKQVHPTKRIEGTPRDSW